MTSAVVGVDGAPGGWVAATRQGVRGFASFRALLDAFPDASIFVDIPIHLLAEGASGYRACDREAKRALGPRGGSVFVPPVRRQLALADEPYRAGLGLSVQTYGILMKIREVDAFREDPRLHEAHPELAFLLANDGRALAPKRTPEGRAQRARILERLGLRFDETRLDVRATRADVDGPAGPSGQTRLRRVDVDDAAILVWLGEAALAGRVGYYGKSPMIIWGARDASHGRYGAHEDATERSRKPP